MQNLSISPVPLTTLAQWQIYSTRFFNRITTLHQIGKISATEHKMITAYLDKLNQALKYYFSLKTLPKQTEQLQSLLAQLPIFAEAQKVYFELLDELQTVLIATKEELLKPMAIDKLPPEILNHFAADNFTSRQALNLSQCSSTLFFGDAGLSFLAKRKRLSELGKFKLTTGGNSCFLSIQNKLFVWGQNEHGQLGLGDNINRNLPVEFDLTRLKLSSGDNVAQVVAGEHHAVLLTQEGRCFVWGENGHGQLGQGHNVNRNSPVEFDVSRFHLAPGDSIVQIVAGINHTIFLTQQERCFVSGGNRNSPIELNLNLLKVAPGDGVAKVMVGRFHTAFFTRQGYWFIWNTFMEHDQANNAIRHLPVKLGFTPLRLCQEDDVAQVIVGDDHSFLFTRLGRCFVAGEVGLRYRTTGEELNFLGLGCEDRDNVGQIMVGHNHAIFLSQRGRCFVWGLNTFGQLGLGDNEERTSLAVELDLNTLKLSPGDGIGQIMTGENHSILLTRQGRCFVWGDNSSGQLGLGDSKFVSTPTEVYYPHLKELKNLWSSLQKEDLATLASLACDKTMDGQTAYQMIVDRLASENMKTRLLILSLIHASPWRQPHLIKNLLAFASLYEPFIETLKDKSSTQQQSITHALAKLMHVYDYFIDKDASSEQAIRQEDFLELLKTLSQGCLKDSDDLSQFLEKNAAKRHLKNFGFTALGISVESPIPHKSARYFDVCQELLTEAKQQAKFLLDLKPAADIILQGLNAATEADGIAFTLSTFLQSKQQPRPTRPGARLSS